MYSTLIRIIIIDDHAVVRKSWKKLLESNPSLKVVADFEVSDSTVEKVAELQPDIVLVDFNRKPDNGLAFTKKILAAIPALKIICLSVKKKVSFVEKMMAAGTKGYLTKTSSLREIQTCILEVNKGESYICEDVKKHISPVA
jgi:two-component system, NarL family, invasion response regulator UvrY